ncbi:10506_t:CDS:2 [Funneliformis caledonium]|uniref:10506_t:CDS:1 n=1 Tax=Funneliformis caledonium TaxID=1117310 RepID=A0A9N9FCS6_9GLOM|nr:10506_t:CDS:2 [Funneliformis caledonium]
MTSSKLTFQKNNKETSSPRSSTTKSLKRLLHHVPVPPNTTTNKRIKPCQRKKTGLILLCIGHDAKDCKSSIREPPFKQGYVTLEQLLKSFGRVKD